MTLSTVSTYAVFQSTLNDVSKTETELSKQQIQLSSGNKSQDFSGMADQTQQFLSLDNVLAKTNQYINDNQIVETRINTTSSVLDQVTTLTNTLQSLISQRRNGVSSNGAFAQQLDGLWQQLTSELNTQVGNQYLFSGTATNTQPVDTQNFPKLQVPGTPDSGYYLGNQQDMNATPQDNTTVTYNVRADAPGFQKLFAAIAMAKQGDANNSDTDLAAANDLVVASQKDIIATGAVVNANKVLYTTVDTHLQNTKLYWQGIQQSIGNTDVVSVSSALAVNQGILQAAFQAFAKITSLRLSDYLK
jgi:flagellar hook-associated protein 3 FlgL